MNDLISRQAAMDALARIFDQCEEIEAHLPKGDPDITGYKMYPDYMIVWEYLHQLPSAEPWRGEEEDDIVQVIRCCDCKWLQHNMKPDGQIPKGVDEYECRHWCGSCDPTDYCSAGERREENERPD